MLISSDSSPFEKSLSKRIDKVRIFLALAKSIPDSKIKSELESIENLEVQLESLTKLNILFFEHVNVYIEKSAERRNLFHNSQSGLKELALRIKLATCDNLKIRANHRKKIKSIFVLIHGQNSLPAPHDFDKPSSDKKMNDFLKSNMTLLNQFRLLINEVKSMPEIPDQISGVVGEGENIIILAESWQKNVEDLIQKIYSIHDERIDIFSNMRERCSAILLKCRYILGVKDQTYQYMRKLKF